MVTDEAFVDLLEACTLPPAEFDHAAHVRGGYIYVRRHGFAGAVDRMATAIRRFATANGKAQLYHETLTVAFLALISERLDSDDSDDWTSFAAANPDLFDKGLMARYYGAETLGTPQARRTFVLEPRAEPDDRDPAVYWQRATRA